MSEAPRTPPALLLSRARSLAAEYAERAGIGLAAATRLVSERYTRARDSLEALRGDDARLVAGLGFFLGRDLPKGAAVFSELASRGALPEGEPLRVLDLGAGVGATTFSLAWVLAQARASVGLEVLGVDLDPRVLEAFHALADVRDPALAPVALRTERADLRAVLPRAEPADVILFGLSLNELEEAERAELLLHASRNLRPRGVVVALEPALAETARGLMRVRDRLVEAGASIAHPCTHHEPCPLLANERDWCHAELHVPLPPEEARIAAEAGLRADKPTFAALALGPPPDDRATVRVVSRPLGSKGKVELDVCGPTGLVRLRALDREGESETLGGAVRGELARVEPLPQAPSARVGRDVRFVPVSALSRGRDRSTRT